MVEQNKINKYSDQLTVNDLLIATNKISSADDLIFSTDATNSVVFENSTNTILDLNSSGQLVNPFQVSFLSYLLVSLNNVTGGNIPFVMYFDTTKYDIGGNFDDQYFTAPQAGLYYFSCSCVVTGLSAAMISLRLNLVTSNQTFNSFTNGYVISTSGTQASIFGNIITQMDAADDCSIELTVSGGSQTADVSGAATLRTYFSGHRIA